MNILLADDHFLVRKGINAIIVDAYPHASIVEVTNGADLMKKLIKQKFDIVISDISMPDKTGLEVLVELKAKGIKIPTIILSMHHPELYGVRSIKAGAYAYLPKNIAPEKLIETIDHIVKTKQKYITPEIAELLVNDLSNDVTKSSHEILSNTELEILKHIAKGKNGNEIAELLHLNPGSVSSYRNRILTKMKLANNAEIIKYAIENNLI